MRGVSLDSWHRSYCIRYVYLLTTSFVMLTNMTITLSNGNDKEGIAQIWILSVCRFSWRLQEISYQTVKQITRVINQGQPHSLISTVKRLLMKMIINQAAALELDVWRWMESELGLDSFWKRLTQLPELLCLFRAEEESAESSVFLIVSFCSLSHHHLLTLFPLLFSCSPATHPRTNKSLIIEIKTAPDAFRPFVPFRNDRWPKQRRHQTKRLDPHTRHTKHGRGK